jgi:EpsI family protein
MLKRHRALIATGLLLGQIGVYYGVSRAEVVPVSQPWRTFPTQIGSWSMQSETPIDQETLDRLRPDDYINRVYATSARGQASGMFVAYFKSQRDGRAPHSPQNCLPGAGWASVSNTVRSIPMTGWPGGSIDVNQYVVQKDREQLVVHYWFQQNNRILTNEIVAQFYAIPTLLLHGRTDIALVRIITPVSTSVDAAAATGVEFARDVFPYLRDRLK